MASHIADLHHEVFRKFTLHVEIVLLCERILDIRIRRVELRRERPKRILSWIQVRVWEGIRDSGSLVGIGEGVGGEN